MENNIKENIERNIRESTTRSIKHLENIESIAQDSLTKLSQQSETLNKIENTSFETTQHAKTAKEHVKYLKSLQKFFMIHNFKKQPSHSSILEIKKYEIVVITNHSDIVINTEIRKNEPQDGLEVISDKVKRIKEMSIAMNNEISMQNKQLDRITESVDTNSDLVNQSNRLLKKK